MEATVRNEETGGPTFREMHGSWAARFVFKDAGSNFARDFWRSPREFVNETALHRRRVVVKGARTGRAPRSTVEKRFDSQLG
jgi:hypothetical protein